ncbi:hypothetical protein L9F63_014172, partial [Diploptera punctata]
MAEAKPQTRLQRHGDTSENFPNLQQSQKMKTEEDDDDDIQISFAPYIRNYLADTGQRPSCCGIFLPIPFERAAKRSWWDPRFDSEILEGQYRRSSFPQVRLRFQYSLFYILVISLSWFIYFIVSGIKGNTQHWIPISVIFALLFFIIATLLYLTYTNVYRHHTFSVSAFVAVLISILSLICVIFNSYVQNYPDITPVGQFSLCIEILLLIYTVIPLPLYVCVAIGGAHSIIFECLTNILMSDDVYETMGNVGIIVRVLLHFCIHLIGIHILIMTNVRMRGTFMKVGQSLLVRRQLEMEKQLKEKMIHSVMPPKVAAWLMSETGGGREDGSLEQDGDTMRYRVCNQGGSDIRSLFRPFNMHCMENVSILFADIVGFTKMSTNKTAEELVDILNGLFERFDDLCSTHGCEKISTLGDCYYCVAGCPEPKPDHAKACVEMGLGMINAIKLFDAERNEGVNMRVGVHTGTVLCGIVGTKRFKFDVWSNDVTLANQMESTGKPGQVHISEATRSFLEDMYLLEDGEIVQGIKTYFIRGRKSGSIAPESSPSKLVPVSRSRVLSCNSKIRPHYHQLRITSSLAEPSNRVKASSLPSILNSDNDNEEKEDVDGNEVEEHMRKSPTSLTGGGLNITAWKYSGRMFKTKPGNGESDESKMQLSVPLLKKTDTCQETDGFQQVLNQNGEATANNTISQLDVPSPSDDQLSVCRSMNSRKDSGIRSNSRRSSIQQQIFVMNGMAQGEMLTHRVSGYYTSSQSSVNDVEPDEDVIRSRIPAPLGENFGICFQMLRKQSDLQLIRCVQDNVASHHSYFVKPPLSSFTLFFRQKEMEREYRACAHRVKESQEETPPTLATSRFNTYFDVFISVLVYFAIAISIFILYDISPIWIAFCIVATTIQIFAMLLCIRQFLKPNNVSRTGTDFSRWLLDKFSHWYPWHICGAILVSLPVVSVLANFDCKIFSSKNGGDYYYCFLLFVGLVHFCNFTQLNCWMKSVMATLAGVIYICLVASHACLFFPHDLPNNITQHSSDNATRSVIRIVNSTLSAGPSHKAPLHYFKTQHGNYNFLLYHGEIFLDVLMLLVLVWFLNREFEISYRLSFHGNIVAARDKARVQNMKNQADWLLHNIIPKHVADELKNKAKYSKNYHDVGIIFASIVNFNEMYDESYLGGKEYLRVLNELIGDFDELLTKPEFKNIEKIKTIGSTFMAASGLNPDVRKQNKHQHQHLFELMDFAMALQKVIDDFNRDLIEFNLVLRVGYNFGDVTAGVIGTTKLYYDIWGDAVNIASRMDSTGVSGRIQVGGDCVPVLSERYEFEKRGPVYVKGKDMMTVYLVKGKHKTLISNLAQI